MTVQPFRAILMSARFESSGKGFHRFEYKIAGDRSAAVHEVTVMISRDAHRKLMQQLGRNRITRWETTRLLKDWAKWAIASRLEEDGEIPHRMTITATDVDDFGAYATGFVSAVAGM